MFSDINNHWAKDCIIRLRNLLIVNGYPDGTFRPQAPVTRAEYAVLMNSTFANAPKIKPAPTFKDVPAKHWAYSAIRTAAEKGFLVGYPDNTFKPEQVIPRVQALIAVAAHLKVKIPQTGLTPDQLLAKYFDDAAEIPNYAKPKLIDALFGFIIVNYPNLRKLRPNQNATRGEIAAILCRALNIWYPILETSVAGKQILAIPAQFDQASNFADGLAWVFNMGEQPKAISTTGIAVIPSQFNQVGSFSQGFAPVQQGELWGYINKRGDFAIQPQFQSAAEFREHRAAVKDNQWGYIDRTGTFAIPPQFEAASHFSQGLAKVKVEGKYGYINLEGILVIQPQFNDAQDFTEGLAAVKGDQWGYIDTTGQMVIPPTFDQAFPFSQGLAKVGVTQTESPYGDFDLYGYIDKTGNLVIPAQFENAQSFSENLAAVSINGKWGYINLQGEVVIQPQFENPQYFNDSNPAQPFSQGLARVKLGTKVTFIDPQGIVVFSDQLPDADSFSEGLARVNVGGEWITESRGYDSSAMPVDFITYLKGGKWGYIRHPFR